MQSKWKATSVALLTAVGLSLFPATMAEAGSKGRRNTAIAAGAVGIYGIVKKKPVLAGLGTGVGVYSYMKSREAAKREKRRRKRVVYWRNGRKYYRYR